MRYEIIGVQGLIYDETNQKVLLTKRRRDNLWVVPGGKVEEGELNEEAVVREVKEETGLDVRVKCKLGEYYRPNWRAFGKKGDKTTVYLCEVIAGRFINNPETSEIKWFGIGNLPSDVPPWHVERIRDAQVFNGRPFIRIQNFPSR